jgi:hypothetical protein
MTSRALILASVLLFVNGCDYSQKKPQVDPGAIAGTAERRASSPLLSEPVVQTRVSDVMHGQPIRPKRT